MVIKKTRDPQSVAADVNEILFGYYLTSSWNDFEDFKRVKTEYDERSKRITPEELSKQEGRAKEQAKVFLNWLKDNKNDAKITKKWWPKQNSKMISEAVGYPVDLDKNPLDLLIKTNQNEFIGISVKSAITGNPPNKNRGLGSVENELGIDLQSIYDLQIKKFLEQYPQIPRVQKDREKWLKENDEFYKNNISKSKFVNDVFSGVRDTIFEKFSTFSLDELWNYLKNYWLDAGDLNPPYVRVIGKGESGKYSAEVQLPIIPKPKDIQIEKIGFDKIRIHYDANEYDIRVKFMSTQMATSIKFSGE